MNLAFTDVKSAAFQIATAALVVAALALATPAIASAVNYSASSNGKVLRVTAVSEKTDPADEWIEVSLVAGQVRINPHTLRFFRLSPTCTRASTVITCNVTDLQRVIVKTGVGDDQVHIDPSITVPTSIVTGNGNDEVLGGEGPDAINTGNGNDGVDDPASGLRVTDEVDGRGGDDKITLGAGNIDPTDEEQPNLFQRAAGGAGDDLITGKSFGDVLSGGEGNDTLKTSYGFDQLDGGDGDDKLSGGSGNDELIGGPGSDSFNASSGDDTLNADDGELDSSIVCGTGVDTLFGDAFDEPATKPGCESINPF